MILLTFSTGFALGLLLGLVLGLAVGLLIGVYTKAAAIAEERRDEASAYPAPPTPAEVVARQCAIRSTDGGRP